METISGIIRELAESLGLAVKDLWPYLVGHARMKAAAVSCFGVPFLVAALVCAGRARRWWNDTEKKHRDAADGYLFGAALLLLLGLVFVLYGLPGALYPQKAAVQTLLEMLP